MKFLFLIFFLSTFFPFHVSAQSPESGEAKLFIYQTESKNKRQDVQTSPLNNEEAIYLQISLKPPSEAYFYSNDSKNGLPTQLSIQIDEENNDLAKHIQFYYPKGKLKRATKFSSFTLPGEDPKDTLIYPGQTSFWIKLQDLPQKLTVSLSIKGLYCTESLCSPFNYSFSPLFIERSENTFFFSSNGEKTQPITSFTGEMFQTEGLGADSATSLLQQSAFVQKTSTNSRFSLAGTRPSDIMASQAKENPSTATANILSQLQPQYYKDALEITGLEQALLFGILAGLILNLMPCVLPVISLKFSALLAVTTMKDKQEQARTFRIHSLAFALGIITWFVFLALMIGLAGWFWGEIFQSPIAVAIIGLVFFVLALSMFDVYTLPILNIRVGSDNPNHWQSFLSGVFATLLATPCSGPLLGGVIGWSVQQTLPVLFASIISVGIGMSIPYLAMFISPRLIHLLPRPGSWTVRLEQLVGFFLLAASAYFMMILPTEWHSAYLIIVVSCGFAAWLWGQIGHLGAKRKIRIIARSCAILVILLAVFFAKQNLQYTSSWEPFNMQKMEALLGKEPLLFEFTADWCPNCKVLEHTTLNEERLARLRKKYNLRTIRVDLTKFDEDGQALLEALGSRSLPLIALFPTGTKSSEPTVLRDIVTPKQLEKAMKKTFSQ